MGCPHCSTRLIGEKLRIELSGMAPLEIDISPELPGPFDPSAPKLPLVRGVPRFASCSVRSLVYSMPEPPSPAPVCDGRHWYLLAWGAVRRAVLKLDQRLVRIARRYPTAVRLRLYRWMRADATGRFAQLAEVCPGAILLAFACQEGRRHHQSGLEAPRPDVIRLIFDDAIAGVPLPKLLARGVAAVNPHPRTHRAHVTMLRYAGPRAPSGSLAGPFAVVVPVEIPSAVRKNALWYRAMHAIPECSSPSPPRLASAFARIVSRDIESIIALRSEGRGAESLVFSVYAFFLERGKVPGTSRRFRDLHNEARRWFRRLKRERDALVREPMMLLIPGWDGEEPVDFGSAPSIPRPPPGFVVPPGPMPDAPLRRPDVSVRPLVSLEELEREGREMSHCVGSQWPSLVTGASIYYSVIIGGARLTLSFMRRDGGWVTAGFFGMANRHPTGAERAAVAPWLASIAPAGTSVEDPVSCWTRLQDMGAGPWPADEVDCPF